MISFFFVLMDFDFMEEGTLLGRFRDCSMVPAFVVPGEPVVMQAAGSINSCSTRRLIPNI